MIVVTANVRIRPGSMPTMLGAVEQMARHSRAEPGCLEYEYLTSPVDEDLLVFLERWQDLRSLTAHLSSDRMAAYRSSTRELVLSRRLDAYDSTEISL